MNGTAASTPGAGPIRVIFTALAACMTLVVSSLLLPSSPLANVGDLSDGAIASDVAETFARVVRVQPTGPETSIHLPVWNETRYPFPIYMTTPWPIIQALQDVPSLPILFVASTDLPPPFIVWLWHEWPSSHYLAFNWERLGLSERGQSSLMMWGLARDPPQPRMACHWWTEKKPSRPLADVLLIDAAQHENSIGCLAAGLLRHLGNPLWQHMAKEFGGQANSEALPKVKRLYDCGLRSEFNFVRANPPVAQSFRDKEEYLTRLDQRVRQDCLANT